MALAGLFLVAQALGGCAVAHRYPAYRGRVLELGTDKPIEGAGVLAVFKTIARQVAGDGVTLNTLLTGQILTDRLVGLAGSVEAAHANAREKVPAGRPGTVEEFAAVAAFLCSAPASYVTGAAIPVDGGMLQGV